MTSTTTDRPAKLARLRDILETRGAAALQLTSAESLAWLFDGARVSVPYGAAPVLSAVVDRDGGIVVTALDNEAQRLRDEELGTDVDLRAVPWFAPLPAPPAGVLAEDAVRTELRAARASLLPVERARYGALGGDAARAMTAVLRSARPDETETALAGRLVGAVVALGAEPVVTLVAGEARGGIPHPLPTAAPLGRRAMAVVGARRHGLVVNLTRWISFGEAEPESEARLRLVEADGYAATRPGRSLDDVLADIATAYERHGFGADAWRRHHQGGPTGYLGRDPKATPETTDVVRPGQAFAWNPWVPGAKLEDTVVVDAEALEVLTADPEWPTVEVAGVRRPVALDLS